MALNTTPRTWVAGETVTATLMNTEVRDALAGIQAAWTSYTPTWSATSAPSLGNGILNGAYRQIGKNVQFRIQLTMGSTTTYGSGNYTFTLPVTAITGQGYPVGLVTISNSTIKTGQANINSTSTIYVIRHSTETLISSSGAGAAWASGHYVFINGIYEAA